MFLGHILLYYTSCVWTLLLYSTLPPPSLSTADYVGMRGNRCQRLHHVRYSVDANNRIFFFWEKQSKWMKSEVTSAEESTRRKITPVIHTFTTTPGNTLVLDPGKTLNPVPPSIHLFIQMDGNDCRHTVELNIAFQSVTLLPCFR